MRLARLSLIAAFVLLGTTDRAAPEGNTLTLSTEPGASGFWEGVEGGESISEGPALLEASAAPLFEQTGEPFGPPPLVVAEDTPSSGVPELPSQPPEDLVVRSGKFRKDISLTGQLVTQSSTRITVPRSSELWSFVVTELAPEGSFARPGDLLVSFDITDLAQKVLELEKQREDARIQIAQKKAEQDANLQDLRLAVATAQKDMETAALYVDIDRSLLAASEADRYQFDYDKAKVELQKAKERLEGHAEASAAELAVTRLEYDRADIELQRIRAELERMTIRAPAPGLVIHGINNDNRKIQVGDTLFSGHQVIALPDMSAPLIRATAFDRDFAQLEIGTPARIVFDAYPGRSFAGSIVGLSEAAKPKDRNSELNLFQVEVLLGEVDLSIMKPGMTARVHTVVETPDSILVSRRAVLLDSEGKSFVRAVGDPATRIPLEVVDGNIFELSVRGNLKAGQKLLEPQSFQPATRSSQTEWIDVKREDVDFTVSATGILKAAESVAIMPPSMPDTYRRFKIIQMVPEGSVVEAGDLLLAFDPSDQIQRLRQEEADQKKVQEELEKVKASQTLSDRDLELQLEEARVQLEKAENKWGTAKQFDSSLNVKEAELEATLAQTRVDLLTRKLESTREHSRLQNKILEESGQVHQRRIQIAQDAIQRLQVRAPRSGVVIYKRNWNNEKKQVGSEARMGDVIMTLPDLESLVIDGQVAEVDAGKVRLGQAVEISLDAIPERTLKGRVVEIGRIFSQPSRDRPIRVLNIQVQFEEPDLARLRPEMVARLELIVNDYRDVLALPLSVIQVEGEDSFIWVQEGKETVKRQIEVGEDNGVVAVVTSGLEEGDRVAVTAPES